MIFLQILFIIDIWHSINYERGDGSMPINRETDTTISVNIDRKLAEKFKVYSKRDNRTMSGQARALIIKYIYENDKKDNRPDPEWNN